MDDILANAIGRELTAELSDALERIGHCLEQLTDAQVWHRADDRNSIGNLLLHLGGNVRQWIVSGLGGVADDRDRPAEFARRDLIPTTQLLADLRATCEQAKKVLTAMTAEQWLRGQRIQGFEVTGLGAAIGSVAHFRGHAQEIVHKTRDLLGERYRFAWVPATPEQGAPA
jgi:hypothetical protein